MSYSLKAVLYVLQPDCAPLARKLGMQRRAIMLTAHAMEYKGSKFKHQPSSGRRELCTTVVIKGDTRRVDYGSYSVSGGGLAHIPKPYSKYQAPYNKQREVLAG